MTTTATDTKACRRCGVDKSLAEYYRQKTGRGGYMAVCKGCQDKRVKVSKASREGSNGQKAEDIEPEENKPQQIPEWREMLRVDIRTGEIKTDRRREHCTWLNDRPGNRRKSYESGD